jgi:hypothetical protein
MASTFKAITDTMGDLGITLWQVKSRGNSLIGYQLDAKLPIDSSIDRLRKLLKEQSGDIITVLLQPNTKEKGGDQKKVIRMDVDLTTVDPGSRAVAGIGNMPDLSKFETMIADLSKQNQALQAQLIESKYQNQIKDLEAKISGVEQNDPIGKVLEMIAPVIAAYLPKLMNPGAKDIHGIPEQDQMLSRLLAVDQDGLKVVEAIVMLAENNPTLYATYKPVLLNMVNENG